MKYSDFSNLFLYSRLLGFANDMACSASAGDGGQTGPESPLDLAWVGPSVKVSAKNSLLSSQLNPKTPRGRRSCQPEFTVLSKRKFVSLEAHCL
jgi:hypothetical protein